jgi:hypothetical protein
MARRTKEAQPPSQSDMGVTRVRCPYWMGLDAASLAVANSAMLPNFKRRREAVVVDSSLPSHITHSHRRAAHFTHSSFTNNQSSRPLLVTSSHVGLEINLDFLLKSIIINVIYRTGLRAKLFSQTV